MDQGIQNQAPGYRLWLVKELARRTEKNPSYSLRAFSRTLGLSPAGLSQVISGKRRLTRKAALQIIERSGMNPDEARSFMSSALGHEWTDTLEKLDPFADKAQFHHLEVETFRAISDWYHYGILGLANLETNQASSRWIASKLRISERDAESAFQRLLRLGIISRVGKGFRQIAPPLQVPTIAHEAAIRKYHRQNLEKAERALESESIALEFFSSITMAIDEDNLNEARELIKKFRRKMCQVLEKGSKQRVYTLSLQLFPISEEEREIK